MAVTELHSTGEVVRAVLAQLGNGPAVRRERTDLDHVAALVESGGEWPPITVTGIEGHIIDGHHRASAARRLGWETIPAVVVEVDHRSVEGLELATKANIEHGLPLSLAERKSIAARFAKETDWSDRRIAAACGLTHKTVADHRPRRAGGENAPPARPRVGADGKAYPTPDQAVERRQAAAREVEAKPTASDREIAQRIGLSPRTVADVRRRNAAGEDAVPPRLRAVPDPTPEDEPPEVTAGDILGAMVAVPWARDERCQVSNAARDFARAMDRFTGRALKGVEQAIAEGCPPGDVADMAAVTARETAAMWSRLADQLTRPRSVRSL